ncbi:hypothetical protein DEM26_18000 [Thioclava sp. NG1]|nr:hypothetical protein DEM26_18000 [Thioclava sp. NG1]
MAIAGMGHNLPPVTVQMPYAERMQIEHRIKRAENKKLWQKIRRKRKWSQRTRYHKLSWSQRKGRLFKGHRP